MLEHSGVSGWKRLLLGTQEVVVVISCWRLQLDILPRVPGKQETEPLPPMER